ncbi:hypothetical protein EJ04DRAFT_569004 [Polyplosphaeria fusca]|uniref:Uncharacterized protein n=1 Tax=Polyplosphaeria fusca TaxID=682080 RepID=A0A9P4QNV7_9PLEO|nr:hypothetical protein EJ04DRAFT_569004 [Polyplosphaeria fusca]
MATTPAPAETSTQPSVGDGGQLLGGDSSSKTLQAHLIRDGRTPATALHSPDIQRDPHQQAYIVNHLGEWIRVSAVEGRHYTALGFSVRNIDTFREGEWIHPLLSPGTGQAFQAQVEEIEKLEDEDLEKRDRRYAGVGS